eukprot:3378006-Rhodomonas_salina.3
MSPTSSAQAGYRSLSLSSALSVSVCDGDDGDAARPSSSSIERERPTPRWQPSTRWRPYASSVGSGPERPMQCPICCYAAADRPMRSPICCYAVAMPCPVLTGGYAATRRGDQEERAPAGATQTLRNQTQNTALLVHFVLDSWLPAFDSAFAVLCWTLLF